VVAAFFFAQSPGDRRDLEQVTLLIDLHLLGRDLLDAAARGLPGRPPLAGQRDLVRALACQLGDRDAQGIGDGDCDGQQRLRPWICTGICTPGEMDRNADRLNEAAGMTDRDDDAARTRPDDGEDEQDEE
jgi:hypothetical protein